MTIIDRRQTNKNKSVGNRQKFLKRYKAKIKRSVEDIGAEKGLTDVLKDRRVIINQDEIEEPEFNFDMSTGERDIVYNGNETLQKGDKIYQDHEDDGQSNQGGPGEDTLDEFAFTLTKEEFLELYFRDMKLPDFIKESMKGSTKYILKRAGYSREGIPPRLDLLKTLKQAMARRIATKSNCECGDGIFRNWEGYSESACLEDCVKCGGTGVKSQRYLDDIDLRYKQYVRKPYPIKHAVMILLMDVSGSMGEFEKKLAKKFYLLLYLFLEKCYSAVELIFISHTSDAEEVTEHEFFYSNKSGGTVVSSGLKLVNEIIDTRVDLSTTNVYVAQASDGDNWDDDKNQTIELVENILTKVQYFAYIQVEEIERRMYKAKNKSTDLMKWYLEINNKKLQSRHVNYDREVYPVLRSLFEGK